MKTSYFSKYRGYFGVSISLYPPKGFSGRRYNTLAPSVELLDWWKSCDQGREDWIHYRDIYYSDILGTLRPAKIVEEIGDQAVLLCHEQDANRCHRGIVAEWLEFNLGIEVPEWQKTRSGTQNRSLHKYLSDFAAELSTAGFTQRKLIKSLNGRLEIPITYEFCKKIFLQVAAAKGYRADLRSIRGEKFLDVYRDFSPAIYRMTRVEIQLYMCKDGPKKYLELLADALESAGHSQNVMFENFKAGFDLNLDMEFMKEIFREVMTGMSGKTSTMELSTTETTQVVEAFSKAIAEITGVSVEWPCVDSLIWRENNAV
jgi:uncharacterized protein YeaO (DUF488 family)